MFPWFKPVIYILLFSDESKVNDTWKSWRWDLGTVKGPGACDIPLNPGIDGENNVMPIKVSKIQSPTKHQQNGDSTSPTPHSPNSHPEGVFFRQEARQHGVCYDLFLKLI